MPRVSSLRKRAPKPAAASHPLPATRPAAPKTRQSSRRTSYSSTAAELAVLSPSSQQPREPNLSLPHSVASSTNITHSKVERRRQSTRAKRNSKVAVEEPEKNAPSSPLPREDKENAADNISMLQSPTPYWKVAKERKQAGLGMTTPPQTRSARKKRPESGLRNRDGPSNRLLEFSPPNQLANARREEEELQRKEQSRSKRIRECQAKGQLLVYSPTMNNVPDFPSSPVDDGEGTTVANETSDEVTAPMQVDIDQESIANDSADNLYTPTNMQVDASEPSDVSAIGGTSSTGKGSTIVGSMHEAEHITSELKSLRATIDQLVQSKSAVSDENKRQQDLLSAVQQVFQLHQAQHKDKTVISDSALLELKSQTADLVKQNSQLEAIVDQLEKSLKSVQEEHQAVTEELQESLDNANLESTGKLRCVEEARNKLSSVLADCQAEQANLKKRLSALEEANKSLKSELAESKTLVASLQEKSTENSQTLAEENSELASVKEHLFSEVDTLMKKIEAYENQTENYQQTIDTLENELLPESESQLEDAVAELHIKTELLMECEGKLEKCRIEMEELKVALQNAVAEQQAERVSFQKLNEGSGEACEQMSQEIKVKESTIAQLEFELENAKNLCELEESRVKEGTEKMAQMHKSLNDRVESLESSVSDALNKLEEANQVKDSLEHELEEATKQIEAAEVYKVEASAKEEMSSKQICELSSECSQLRQRMQELEGNLQATFQERNDAFARLETFDARENGLFMKLRESDRVRRDLHNRVMQLSGNIRVYVRVRPALETELQAQQSGSNGPIASGRKRKLAQSTPEEMFRFPGIYDRSDKMAKSAVLGGGADDLTKNLIEVIEPYKDRGGLSDRRKKWKFGFDHVFHQEHGQEEIWAAAEPLVQSTIDGFNVTLFAYGQTGSGKTYTMLGEPGNEGLITRSVKKLFEARKEIMEFSQGATTVELSVELLEIYNEKVRDLLSPDSELEGKDLASLKVNPKDGIGNIQIQANTREEVFGILDKAQKRRCVKATASNAVSSRGHMIFTIHYAVQGKDGVNRSGKLHICDLAGSERLSKSNANNHVGSSLLKETKHINTSLSVLSNVIEKLQAGESSIPYRESKLTHVLQNSLGGNSKTLAIVCCNPLPSHFHESLCSLRFAAKVNKVDLKAVANFSC